MKNKKRAISINLTWVVLILVALKIFGVINFDWIWIFSPLWIPIGLMLIILIVGMGLPILAYIIMSLFGKK